MGIFSSWYGQFIVKIVEHIWCTANEFSVYSISYKQHSCDHRQAFEAFIVSTYCDQTLGRWRNVTIFTFIFLAVQCLSISWTSGDMLKITVEKKNVVKILLSSQLFDQVLSLRIFDKFKILNNGTELLLRDCYFCYFPMNTKQNQ